MHTTNPLLTLAERNPEVVDDHAKWLSKHGEALLDAVERSVRPELWPWDRPTEEQASFGAFCSGVAWATSVLRRLPTLVNDRRKMAEMMAAGGEANVNKEVEKLLMEDFGYTPEQLKGTKK